MARGSITVHATIKKVFFDRAAVLEKIGKENASILARSMGAIRKISRNSLRRRKKKSAPGTPPSVHSTHPYRTLKNILFGLSSNAVSGIVGPVGFAKSRSRGVVQANVSVPNLHEFGGTARRVRKVRINPPKKTGRKASSLQAESYKKLLREGRIASEQAQFEYREETARYPKRAFMRPALNVFRERYPELMRRTVAEVV